MFVKQPLQEFHKSIRRMKNKAKHQVQVKHKKNPSRREELHARYKNKWRRVERREREREYKLCENQICK
jgi:hypothetical protein